MKSTAIIPTLLAVLLIMPSWVPAQDTPAVVPEQTYVPAAAEATVTDEVQARYWVDRTAFFPGDRVNYHLQIDCAAGVDLLVEDLDAGQLDVNGLELISSGQTVSEEDGKRAYHVRYTFTTYDLNTAAMQIGAQTIRYYAGRSTGPAGARSPAGEIVIPPTQLSLRSTLATAPMQSRLRDGVSAFIMEGGSEWLGKTGLLFILFSGAPVGWWAMLLMRERSGRIRQQKMEQRVVRAEQGELDRLSSLVSAGETDRRQGYDELVRVLREVVTHNSGINAAALTASQLATRLASYNPGIPIEQLIAVFSDCELARYGRPGQMPDAERFRTGVELARRLLTAN